jgi:hypothetical protein
MKTDLSGRQAAPHAFHEELPISDQIAVGAHLGALWSGGGGLHRARSLREAAPADAGTRGAQQERDSESVVSRRTRSARPVAQARRCSATSAQRRRRDMAAVLSVVFMTGLMRFDHRQIKSEPGPVSEHVPDAPARPNRTSPSGGGDTAHAGRVVTRRDNRNPILSPPSGRPPVSAPTRGAAGGTCLAPLARAL